MEAADAIVEGERTIGGRVTVIDTRKAGRKGGVGSDFSKRLALNAFYYPLSYGTNHRLILKCIKANSEKCLIFCI